MGPSGITHTWLHTGDVGRSRSRFTASKHGDAGRTREWLAAGLAQLVNAALWSGPRSKLRRPRVGAYELHGNTAKITLNTLEFLDQMRLLRGRWQAGHVTQQLRSVVWLR